MWRSKLLSLLATEPQPFELCYNDGNIFSGKYLWIELASDYRVIHLRPEPYVLGKLIGEGDEAQVYELIRLSDGSFYNVLKICKYPPGHAKYNRWIEKKESDINYYSSIPEIEQAPSFLLDVPGGSVKLQQYFSANPDTDWNNVYPAIPIIQLIHAHKWDEAYVLTLKKINLYGPKAIFLEHQGLILTKQKKYYEAKDCFQRSFAEYKNEKNFNLLISSLNYGYLLMELYDETYDNLPGLMKIDLGDGNVFSQQVVPFDPNNHELDTDYSDQALEAFIESLTLEPYFIPGLIGVLRILDRTPEPGMIKLVVNAIAKVDRRMAEELYTRFNSYFSATPSPPLEKPMEMSPENALALKQWEDTYTPPIAETLIQAQTLAFQARHYFGKQDYKRAEESILMAVDLEPNNFEHRLILCSIYNTQAEYEKSFHLLENIKSEFTDDFRLYRTLGLVCFQLEKLRESCLAFHQAISSNPGEDWLTVADLANSYRKMKNFSRATEQIKAAFEHQPDNEEILYFYLLILRDRANSDDHIGNEFDEAISIFNHIKKSNLLSDAHLAAMAQINIIFGNVEDAKGNLREALVLNPSHPFATQFLHDLEEEV